jgi:RND family efflux transporter MFP subunit
MKPRLWAAAAITCAAAVPTGCGGRAESEAAAPPPAAELALHTAETITVALPLSLPGQVYVEHDAWVYARTTGVAESVLVDLGAGVRAGQLLAQLEHVDQEIAVGQAEVAYQNARREVERQRQLAQSRMVAAADSERAEADFRTADLALQQARRNLELTRISAPFSGVVAARVLRQGRLVQPGDSLFRITATAPLLVAVHVPEPAARSVSVGASAWVESGGAGSAATVIRAAPTLDAASGTREVVLRLQREARFQPGSAVTARLGGERRRVVALAAEAVADSGYVLVWQDGRTTLRAVTVGARLPDGRIEIISGLAAGDRVARPGP